MIDEVAKVDPAAEVYFPTKESEGLRPEVRALHSHIALVTEIRYSFSDPVLECTKVQHQHRTPFPTNVPDEFQHSAALCIQGLRVTLLLVFQIIEISIPFIKSKVPTPRKLQRHAALINGGQIHHF